jgi:Flp pilus assembly pilin Flp
MSAKVEIIEKNVSAKKQKGATLVEYALLVGLIVVGAIAAITAIGGKVSSSFSSTNAQFPG